jgi:hypothetical protein
VRCPDCGAASRVRESRAEADGVFLRRRRECAACSYRFNTFEVSDALECTLKKYLRVHVKAVKLRWAQKKRNAEIVSRVLGGEKRYLLAPEYGLSISMLTTITRRAGLAPRSRVNPGARTLRSADNEVKETPCPSPTKT